jgi:hypothetical protein
MSILNLTSGAMTDELIAAGVVDPDGQAAEEIRALLFFEEIPSPDEIRARAERIAEIAARYRLDSALVDGGVPWILAPLEIELLSYGLQPLFAFFRCENGTPRHAGFVESAAE